MKFLNALEQAQWHIRTLWGMLGLLLVLNLIAYLGWWHTQATLKVEIPPRIPQSGLTLTRGEVPKTTVYSFAFYIWQSLNHWPNNGLNDYKQRIQRLSPFLTPGFKAQLVAHYNRLLAQGELQQRIRLVQAMKGTFYAPQNVKILGDGTWVVQLKLRLTEMMPPQAHIVKDICMAYTLKVVRFNVDATQNPWGLALAGFAARSKRLKTFV